MTDVVLTEATWTAILAEERRSQERAAAFAALLPNNSTIELHDGGGLIRTITTGAWSVGSVQADGRYPIVPGTFADPATGSGTPTLAIVKDSGGDEVCRMPAGVGSGTFRLANALSGGTAINKGSFVLLYATDDEPAEEPEEPVETDWVEIALSDMRRPDYVGTYTGSYSPNDDTFWGANPVWSFRTRAMLQRGRYALPEAFNPAVNPDYSEVTWVTDPVAINLVPTRILPWIVCHLSDTYESDHLTGWNNNTRCQVWDWHLWIKSKSTGQWSLLLNNNVLGGNGYDARYNPLGTQYLDIRTESNGLRSVRVINDASAPYAGYYTPHCWCGFASITASDIADIMICVKTSLVVHDPTKADDRAYTRYLLSAGGDYYPPSGGITVAWPAIGMSRMKWVEARWPDYQWHVLHTMTESQFEAPGGYPTAMENE